MNWLGGDFAGTCQAKVRSLAKPVPARLDGGMLHFLSPEYGVAPGQAAVLYDGDRVLGGGWIAVTQAARSEEHTSELQSLMRISYAVFCLKKKKKTKQQNKDSETHNRTTKKHKT